MAVGTVSVTVLGSTGSIGTSTLDVMAAHPDRFRVAALTGHRNVELLAWQCRRFRPEVAVVADAAAAADLEGRLRAEGVATEVQHGTGGLEAAVDRGADITVAAIVGAAGLAPTLRAVRHGGRILLANKESLVMAGPLFMDAVVQAGAELLPLDSEHNAIFQCLPRNFSRGCPVDSGIARVVLTASGGPFRGWSDGELAAVTPAQACAHPNWSMGRKISVDSATLMNKGLEVIEASWLFGLSPEELEVVIHPQSIVHSLVAYRDGSMLAQLGQPDMRVPIAHALGWPERLDSGVAPLDLASLGRLDFEAPDTGRFPCLGLAYRALEQGGTAGAVLNAANEEAVHAFLDGRLPFMGIAPVIEETLARTGQGSASSVAELMDADRQARREAAAVIETRARVAPQ